MIEEKGEICFGEANGMNIPVDISLAMTACEDTSAQDGTWTLSASVYQPRCNRVSTNTFIAISDKREELVELITRHVLPLYETATHQLRDICAGKAENLYHWTKSSS